MEGRFAFRQIDIRDFEMFLRDGEIRSKNHTRKQSCHKTSYDSLVDLRSTQAFDLPCGGVVNDYVAFYFSPLTGFTHTIHNGNVDVTSPCGKALGKSRKEDRAFLVFSVVELFNASQPFCFSNAALNSANADLRISSTREELPDHVDWKMFDDMPMVAKLPSIGYNGVCKFFGNSPDNGREHRAQKRMAELLVHTSVPMSLAKAIVLPTPNSHALAKNQAAQHGFRGAVIRDSTLFV